MEASDSLALSSKKRLKFLGIALEWGEEGAGPFPSGSLASWAYGCFVRLPCLACDTENNGRWGGGACLQILAWFPDLTELFLLLF